MVKFVQDIDGNGGRPDCRRHANSKPSVLIVDDDPRVVDVLQELLEDEGFKVHCEGDGRNALHSIERHQPDVVLADMRMPIMDGVTLLQEITDRWEEIDVIMMSATESPAGLPVPFIQKPFDLEEVVSTICECDNLSQSTS